MTGKGSLFGDIIEGIKKSMGGGGSSTTSDGGNTGGDGTGSGEGYNFDPDDTIEAADVIKALTDQVEGVIKSQEEIAASVKELIELVKQDNGFKKSISDGVIALLETTEKISGSPAARRGITNAAEAGIQKGNLTGGTIRKHRQLTTADKNELTDVLTKAVQEGELSIMDSGKLETQINKSIRDPNFQIEPRLLAFLEKKLAKSA